MVAVIGTGMTLRESMVFSAFSSVKACTDHSGYKFPWNPIDLFTTVDAAYHDKHHQRWGFKVLDLLIPFLPFFLIYFAEQFCTSLSILGSRPGD